MKEGYPLYDTLSIHQKISLKGFFLSKKERADIGVLKDDNFFSGLCALALLSDWRLAIEIFLEQ